MNASMRAPGTLTLATFGVVVLLGGGNFLAVRFSNQELDPFWGAGLRFSLAALVFVAIATSLRLPLPRGRQLALTAGYGVVSFTLSYALMYWALVEVTAGMVAVVLAIVPLVTPLLAAAQKLEQIDRRAIVGAVIALAGIVWMTIGPEGVVVPLGGLIAVLAASLTIGQSVILGKRVSANHPAMTNAVGMSVGGPLLLGLSALAGETWAIPTQTRVIASVTYLVLFGSVGLFVASLMVVRHWTASAMSYAFVLFPVVTMLLEAWLGDVPLTLRGIAGAGIVMTGVWFGAFRSAPRHSHEKKAPEVAAAS